MEENLSSRANVRRWFQTIWGVFGVSFGIIALIFLIYFGVLFFKYWSAIKSGQGDFLFDQIYGGFSSASVNQQDADIRREDIETADDPFLGNPNAEIVIVEFVDFKCPNCRAAAPIMKKVLQKYGNKVKLIIRDFPVESTHPGASQIAEIANCSLEQGLYWIAHDWFYDNQDRILNSLSFNEIKQVSEEIGLNYEKLSICMRQPLVKSEINRDFADGYKAGVGGTPTFFVNGKKAQGVVPFEVWINFLENYQKK